MIIWLDLIYYLLIWAIFGFLHSFLASKSLKKIIPLDGQLYRIGYNIINSVAFIIVLYLVPPITPVLFEILQISLWRQLITVCIFMFGTIILSWGISSWDITGFLGFTKEEKTLNTSGPYRFSRHPVYSGIIIILISLLFIKWSVVTLSWLIGAGGYFLLGTFPEEQKLQHVFGEKYNIYRKDTARLFPYQKKHFKRILTIKN